MGKIKKFGEFNEGKVNEISKQRLAATKKVKTLYPNLGDKEANQLAISMDMHFSPDWSHDSDGKLKDWAKATAEQEGIKLD